MSQERMDRERRAQRGAHAARLLEDPVLREAFDTIDARCVERWREADTPEKREAAWADAHALEEVRRELHSIMADGQYAQAGIDRRKEV